MKIYSPNGRVKKSFYVDPIDLVHAGGQLGIQRFYNPCTLFSTSTNTITVGANFLHATAFIAPRRLCKIKNIAVFITTLQAAQNCVFGVYANYQLGTLYPGKLVFQSQQISTASTGRKDNFVDIELCPGGIYWLALLTSSSTAVFRSSGGAPFGSIFLGDTGNLVWNTSTVYQTYSTTFTYNSTLPPNYPANGRHSTMNQVVPVFFEFAS